MRRITIVYLSYGRILSGILLLLVFSTPAFAKIDIVFERPKGCKTIEAVSAGNISDQQLAIDKLVAKARWSRRGNTLLVLNISAKEVVEDRNSARTLYDIEGLILHCKETR